MAIMRRGRVGGVVSRCADTVDVNRNVLLRDDKQITVEGKKHREREGMEDGEGIDCATISVILYIPLFYVVYGREYPKKTE